MKLLLSKTGQVCGYLEPTDPRIDEILASAAAARYTEIDVPQEVFQGIKKGAIYQYTDGVFSVYTPQITEPSAEEKRKTAYASEALVAWEGEPITIDKANEIYLAYFAENDMQTASQIQQLIIEAKVIIRTKYPDNHGTDQQTNP